MNSLDALLTRLKEGDNRVLLDQRAVMVVEDDGEYVRYGLDAEDYDDE